MVFKNSLYINYIIMDYAKNYLNWSNELILFQMQMITINLQAIKNIIIIINCTKFPMLVFLKWSTAVFHLTSKLP